MLFGTMIFQLVPDRLFRLFGVSEEMLFIGVPAVRVISSYFVFEGFCLISQTGFQSFGKGFVSLVCSLTRQVIVFIPAAYVLSLSGDINDVWMAYPITGITGMAFCLLLWNKIFKKIIVHIPDIPIGQKALEENS